MWTVEVPKLEKEFENVSLITLTAKKWHWRARVSSLQLLDKIPEKDFTHLLTSSVLPLAELLGMCPRLISCKKIIYVHENQLVYPIQEVKNRDVQFGSVFGKKMIEIAWIKKLFVYLGTIKLLLAWLQTKFFSILIGTWKVYVPTSQNFSSFFPILSPQGFLTEFGKSQKLFIFQSKYRINSNRI